MVRLYFSFNRRERNGVFVLVLLLMGLYVARWVREELGTDPPPLLFRVMELVESAPVHSQKEGRHNDTSRSTKQKELFAFDPNHLDAGGWQRLGLHESAVRMIRKFLDRGGRFRRKEDLKKMYCIDSATYHELEPWIRIGKKDVRRLAAAPARTALTELNSCDTLQLMRIPGIGKFYAKAIVRYREELGGYVKEEQLLEIWKFDEEKLWRIRPFITVDASKIRKIRLNSCTLDELRHPYLRYAAASGIINYRKHHGKFHNVEELKNTDLVDEETVRKIAPYLSVD